VNGRSATRCDALSTLQRWKAFAASCSAGITQQSLRVDFKAAIENVEETDKSLLPEDIKKSIAFENTLCDVISSINDKAIADAAAIAASTADVGPTSSAPSNSRDSFQINVPTLNFKTFSGNYKEFRKFI
jgi:hypothetical protein